MRLTAHPGGFSLIEAVVAVALLALGCAAVAGVVSTSLRAQAADVDRREASCVLGEEAARLRALPFFRRAAGPGEGPSSLLAEVFPHGDAALNVDNATFGDVAGEAVFVTVVSRAGYRLRRTARLARETDDGPALGAGDLSGWTVWSASRPPALVVTVRLEVLRGAAVVGAGDLTAYGLRPSLDGAVARSRPGAMRQRVMRSAA